VFTAICFFFGSGERDAMPAIFPAHLPAFRWSAHMLKPATASLIALALAAAVGGAHAQDTGAGRQNSSANALCWDTLQNVAREKPAGEGKLGVTGDLRGGTTGSPAESREQRPGAEEPKDSSRVTSGVTSEGRMISGSAARPAGIPDC
jgi:hypothetical protein